MNNSADALGDLARRARFDDALAHIVAQGDLVQLVLSKTRRAVAKALADAPLDWFDAQRVAVKPVQLKSGAHLALRWTFAHREEVHNLQPQVALALIGMLLDTRFQHAHLLAREEALQLVISQRGKVALKRSRASHTASDEGHSRSKTRWVAQDAPFLHLLGVTDGGGQVVPAMARKWKQINKFVEVLDGALRSGGLIGREAALQVADFGAGKGYLTFALAQHLQTVGQPAQVLGVELRPGLVDEANAHAKASGLPGLSFRCGDVNDVRPERLDVMVALHACDTATDVAIHTGIQAGAAVIVCSPCCHKQLRPQLALPEVLRPLLRHGVHLGQEAEMLTDGVRALLLEAQGYATQVFEFVSLEHTAKNKLILAVRRPGEVDAARRQTLLAQYAQLKAFYGFGSHQLAALLNLEASAESAA
ncbi:MAG: SAM-dependent methyltransferase [Proteobacteria bacterium]|nr:SAM-dependent methyltransferase [Pseudomonadota bacterium]